MGCGIGKEPEIIINTINTRENIYMQIKNLIKLNPFYSSNITQLTNIINQISSENQTEFILNKISYHFKLDELQTSLLSDVIKYSIYKLEPIFPKSLSSPNSCIIDILQTLFFFLSNENKKDKKQMFNFFKDLIIRTSKVNNNKERNDSYSSGKLAYLILEIFQFITFSFVYFFVGISLIDLMSNIDKEGINTIFIQKEKWDNIEPKNLNSYINDKLNLIGINTTTSTIVEVYLKECFAPLKDEILENSEEEIVYISNEKIDNLISNLCALIQVDDFIDVFFTGKVKHIN